MQAKALFNQTESGHMKVTSAFTQYVFYGFFVSGWLVVVLVVSITHFFKTEGVIFIFVVAIVIIWL